MGSLMDGIEVTPAASSGKKGSKSAESSESGKTLKLVIAIGGLLIGGGLIAWNLMPTPPVTQPSGAATSDSGAVAGGNQAPRNTQGTASSSTSDSSGPAPAPIKSGPRTFTR